MYYIELATKISDKCTNAFLLNRFCGSGVEVQNSNLGWHFVVVEIKQCTVLQCTVVQSVNW